MKKNTQRHDELIASEREKMLNGRGVFAEAQKQLDAEAAEEFYDKIKLKQKPRKYSRSSDEQVYNWAGRTADMIHKRLKKRGEI